MFLPAFIYKRFHHLFLYGIIGIFSVSSQPFPTGEDLEGAVIFGGRLAEYKYYDMAPVMEKVLKCQIL